MKSFLTLLCLLWSVPAWANGIGIADVESGTYVHLARSVVDVEVDAQVSRTTATHTFQNRSSTAVPVTYAFPLPNGASATGLRWQINGVWQEAVFTESPSSGPPGGGEPHPSLATYLEGSVPFYFGVDDPLEPGSALVVELSYVELLPYAFGDVEYVYPNDYRTIQTIPLDEQRLSFMLTSPRTIDALSVLSHSGASTTNDGVTATASWSAFEVQANANYRVRYTLSAQDLGLFGYSTLLPESAIPDDGPSGFLLFVAEPDPGTATESIDKVFTLIVDRSGSMQGNKMTQARNASRFIVENLNEGDSFNIVDFSSDITSFRPEHVPFTPANRSAALSYISAINAEGATNISGAFSTAVPQFEAASDETANIIIFLTDGQATEGITDTEALLSHVRTLIAQTETGILLFSFGIGDSVERQLLSRLASENSGIAAFLGSDELEARITEFYLTIRNPVLLNTEVSFSPQVVSRVHPGLAPNLYKGQQMIVAGRYSEAVPVTVTLSGDAFGQPVTYSYPLDLSDSTDPRYQFLTKVWAKLTIEDLLVAYYGFPEGSSEADAIRDQIVDISLAFGVVSPFTGLGSGQTTSTEETVDEESTGAQVVLLDVSPNPTSTKTRIRFRVEAGVQPQTILVKVYSLLGQLVRVLPVRVTGEGIYEVEWDTHAADGSDVAAGVYVYVIETDRAVLGGKLTVLR